MIITEENAMEIQAAYIGLAKKDYFDNFLTEEGLKSALDNDILMNLDTEMIYNEIVSQKKRSRQ